MSEYKCKWHVILWHPANCRDMAPSANRILSWKHVCRWRVTNLDETAGWKHLWCDGLWQRGRIYNARTQKNLFLTTRDSDVARSTRKNDGNFLWLNSSTGAWATQLVGLLWTRLNTYVTHNKRKRRNTRALSGIRTRETINRAPADLRLRPPCHLDRRCNETDRQTDRQQ